MEREISWPSFEDGKRGSNRISTSGTPGDARNACEKGKKGAVCLVTDLYSWHQLTCCLDKARNARHLCATEVNVIHARTVIAYSFPFVMISSITSSGGGTLAFDLLSSRACSGESDLRTRGRLKSSARPARYVTREAGSAHSPASLRFRWCQCLCSQLLISSQASQPGWPRI